MSSLQLFSMVVCFVFFIIAFVGTGEKFYRFVVLGILAFAQLASSYLVVSFVLEVYDKLFVNKLTEDEIKDFLYFALQNETLLACCAIGVLITMIFSIYGVFEVLGVNAYIEHLKKSGALSKLLRKNEKLNS